MFLRTRRLLGDCGRLFDRLLFRSGDSLALECVRIAAALGLIVEFLTSLAHLQNYGFFAQGLRELSRPSLTTWIAEFSLLGGTWPLWVSKLFVLLLLLLSLCLLFGLRTTLCKWLLFLGFQFYFHSLYMLSYGADFLTLHILFIFLLAPIGRRLSLDARRQGGELRESSIVFARRTFCLRLLQFHAAAMFFFNGVGKIQNAVWLSGEAVWMTVVSNDFLLAPELLLPLPPLLYGLNYFTLLLELGYPFAVWAPASRRILVPCAVLLHIGIGLALGLWYFSLMAIALHLSFLSEGWLSELVAYWRELSEPESNAGIEPS